MSTETTGGTTGAVAPTIGTNEIVVQKDYVLDGDERWEIESETPFFLDEIAQAHLYPKLREVTKKDKLIRQA